MTCQTHLSHSIQDVKHHSSTNNKLRFNSPFSPNPPKRGGITKDLAGLIVLGRDVIEKKRTYKKPRQDNYYYTNAKLPTYQRPDVRHSPSYVPAASRHDRLFLDDSTDPFPSWGSMNFFKNLDGLKSDFKSAMGPPKPRVQKRDVSQSNEDSTNVDPDTPDQDGSGTSTNIEYYTSPSEIDRYSDWEAEKTEPRHFVHPPHHPPRHTPFHHPPPIYRGRRFHPVPPQRNRFYPLLSKLRPPRPPRFRHAPSQNNFHNINHLQQESTKSRILGSGNFGVLRGGTFLDGLDYLRDYQAGLPENHHPNYDSFLSNFRDFADIHYRSLLSENQEVVVHPDGTPVEKKTKKPIHSIKKKQLKDKDLFEEEKPDLENVKSTDGDIMEMSS